MSTLYARTMQGRNFPTKKALTDAVKNGETFTLSDTALNGRGTLRFPDDAEKIQPSDVVVGPDAYNRRVWYASIRLGKNGYRVS